MLSLPGAKMVPGPIAEPPAVQLPLLVENEITVRPLSPAGKVNWSVRATLLAVDGPLFLYETT